MTGAGTGGVAVPGGGLSLEVVAGNAAGSKLVVGERIVFGRHSEDAGQLENDPELSRQHAQISVGEGGRYVLEDLASTNGTYVNGARVQTPVVLGAGDMIDLGTTRLVVRETPTFAASAPAVEARADTVPGIPTIARPRLEAEPPPTVEAPPAVTEPPPAVDVPPTVEVRAAEPQLVRWPPRPPQPPPTAEAPPVPPLELRLSIDISRGEAEIALAEGGEPVRLRLQEGHWRIVGDV